jgi:long-chain fatty acid transport protein
MNKSLRFGFACAALALLASSGLANGLNLNSLGTRALGMGGAFVGVADDFSAIFWNPAGAGFFKTRVLGFYGTDILPTGTYRFDRPSPAGMTTVVDARTNRHHYLGGLGAYFHPVSPNVVLGLGVYTPSGIGADWNGAAFAPLAAGKTYDWNSLVGMVSISPLVAWRVGDRVSVGATLNFNRGKFGLNMYAGETPLPVAPYSFDLGQYQESLGGWGFGATFGVLARPSDAVSLGVTLRTPSTITLKGDATIFNLPLLGYPETSEAERTVAWPLWLGAGIGVRPVRALLLSADVQWTQWSKIKTIETSYRDPVWRVLMAASGRDEMAMFWSDKMQVRFGAEYTASPALALRAGYYSDPSPTPDRTLNVLLPSFDFNVLTAGLGYTMGGLQLDFGIEFLMGKDRSVDLLKTMTDPEWEAATPGVFGMRLVVPNLSVSYRF